MRFSHRWIAEEQTVAVNPVELHNRTDLWTFQPNTRQPRKGCCQKTENVLDFEFSLGSVPSLSW